MNDTRAGATDSPIQFTLQHRDYFCQVLKFKWPAAVDSTKMSAFITVTQPCKYRHKLTAEACKKDGSGNIEIQFPLIDDGLFSAERGKDYWEMGMYRFEIELKDENLTVGSGMIELDPNDFFGKIGDRKLAQVDSLRQFIECAPDCPVFIDRDEIGFTTRTVEERVEACTVEADVVEPETQSLVAGPVVLNLDGNVQHHSFKCSSRQRGECWLRLRVILDGECVGPYLVRRFRMETAAELIKPELPLRPGNRPQYMVDGWLFSSSEGLCHNPDRLERLSDGPVIKLDRPWEKGPQMVSIESFSWDAEEKQYRITYFAGPIFIDPEISKKLDAELYHGSRYLCLAVSPDGVHWEKPELGFVEFEGSRENNILRDMQKEDNLLSGEYDSFPVQVKERPIPERYRYRFYDPETDGPVDMDRFVLRLFQDFNMEHDYQFEGGFKPAPGEFWGFERRGDLFLALTHEPILHEHKGYDLYTTTERASTYPFEGEKVALFSNNGRGTSTFYDRRSKTFYYFFRPNFPAYPPHGMPYYLTHRYAQIRVRAVMWTVDGIHWKRRYMISPDEHDVPGTTLYGFGIIRPEGSLEIDTDGQLCLGTIEHWNLRTQTTVPELIWSRDHIHWHRFGANRKPVLPSGPVGSYDNAVRRLSVYYSAFNPDGEEEWWFPYDGTNARYMLYCGKEIDSLEKFKEKYPYFRLAPFFTTWEDFYKEAKSNITLPAMARCKAGRLAHVEPVDTEGEFTTHPLVSEGSRLWINARTEAGGSIRVELQDPEGNVFPGFSLDDCIPFSGNKVKKEMRWKRARVEEINWRVVRLRFVLNRAQLFTFNIGN